MTPDYLTYSDVTYDFSGFTVRVIGSEFLQQNFVSMLKLNPTLQFELERLAAVSRISEVVVTDVPEVVGSWVNEKYEGAGIPKSAILNDYNFQSSFTVESPYNNDYTRLSYVNLSRRYYAYDINNDLIEQSAQEVIGHELGGHALQRRVSGDVIGERNAVDFTNEHVSGPMGRPYRREYNGDEDTAILGDPDDGPTRSLEEIGNFCFSGETTVLMVDGTSRPIKELKAGEWISAVDLDNRSGALVAARISAVHVSHGQQLIELADGTQVTGGHRFLTGRQTFERLDDIQARGGTLMLADSRLVCAQSGRTISAEAYEHVCLHTVQKISLAVGQDFTSSEVDLSPYAEKEWCGAKLVPGLHTVYNLTVAKNHSYIAGNAQYRVHNDSLLARVAGAAIGATAGAILTQQLLDLFGNDSEALAIGANVVGGTLGAWVGESIGAEIYYAVGGEFDNPDFELFSTDKFAGSLITQAINMGGAKLGTALAHSLGIDGEMSDVVASTIGGATFQYAAAQVAIALFPETAAQMGLFGVQLLVNNAHTTTYGVAGGYAGSLMNAGAGALGSFLGGKVANAIFDDAGTLEANIGGAIGATVGAAVGASVLGGTSGLLVTSLAIAPLYATPIGIFVGAFIGIIIGTGLGSLFGNEEEPGAEVTVDYDIDEFGIVRWRKWDGGDLSIAENMGNAAADFLNGVAGAVGGLLVPGQASLAYEYGYNVDKFYAENVATGEQHKFANPIDATENGILRQLEGVQFEGGDIYVKRALANGTYNSMEELGALVTLAKDYGLYKDNPALFEARAADAQLMVENGVDLVLAMEGLIEGAEALGLHLDHAVDWYTGSAIAQLLFGHNSNDSLSGDAGGDVLMGNRGNDTLEGKAGDDLYAFNRGDGIDVILDEYWFEESYDYTTEEPGGQDGGTVTVHHTGYRQRQGQGGLDVLYFGTGIAASDLTLSITTDGQGRDQLVIEVRDPTNPGGPITDKVTIRNWDEPMSQVELFEFADGSQWNVKIQGSNPVLVATGQLIQGGAAGDSIVGGFGADVLAGGLGADTLLGGGGDDVYRFNRGGGKDLVWDDLRFVNEFTYDAGDTTGTDSTTVHRDGGADAIEFGAGITIDDLVIWADGKDMVISVRNPANPSVHYEDMTDQIRIKDGFGLVNRVEFVRFADGTEAQITEPQSGVAQLVPINNVDFDTDGASNVPPQTAALVVFDLGEDGLQITPSANSNAMFDIDGDGFMEQTAWIGLNDAFLVLDRNQDGLINDTSEMFATYGAAVSPEVGPAALSSLDTNGDGIFDRYDNDWDKVRLWVDSNQNGQTEIGELMALHRFGMAEISTAHQGWTETHDGVEIKSRSFFTQMGVWDRQYGTVYGASLFHEDKGVRVVVEEGDDTVGYIEFEDGQSIAFGGSEVDGITDEVSVSGIYTGTADNEEITASANEAGAGGMISARGGDDTVVGSDGSDQIEGGLGNDSINGGAGDDIIVIDDEDKMANIQGGEGFDLLVNVGQAARNLDLATYGFEAVIGGDGADTFTTSRTDEDFVAAGGFGADSLIGNLGDDRLEGEDGNDVVKGGSGNDLLRGGAGIDTVNGGDGDDVLYLDAADVETGQAHIDGGAGYDVAVFEGDGDVEFDAAPSNVEMVVADAGDDTITNSGPETVRIMGGGGDDQISGGEANDELVGGSGNDIARFSGDIGDYEIRIAGGQVIVRDLRSDGDGEDILSGIERLIFDGDGTIVDLTDKGEFSAAADIDLSSVSYAGLVVLPQAQSVSDVLPRWGGVQNITYSVLDQPANGAVTVEADGTFTFQNSSNFSGLDSFTYKAVAADGAVVIGTMRIIVSSSTGGLALVGTDGRDVLTGGQHNDTIVGGGGDDALNGGGGVDTAVFAGKATDYDVEVVSDGQGGKLVRVTDLDDGDNVTEFRNIEQVVFSDRVVAVDFKVNGDPTFKPVAEATNLSLLSGQTQISSTLGGFDLDGGFAGLTFAVQTAATHGSVSINANGTFTYTKGGSSATDTFQFKVTDADGNVSIATVNVEVPVELSVNTYINNHQQTPAVAALLNGGFVAVWDSSGQDGNSNGIYAQRYDGNAAKAGSEFKVNTYTTNSQSDPAITGLSDGGFIVVWESAGQDGSNWGIYGQRYNSSGSTVGSEFLINNTTSGAQASPAVSGFDGGGFVVTWALENGGSSEVYFKRYDSSGSAIGSEVALHSTPTGALVPDVVTLEDGGYVIVWEHQGSDWDIYGQRFDSSGDPVGIEFQVNTTTTNDQVNPSVTRLEDGNFVVVWESAAGATVDIVGQVFDATGGALGSEFSINTYLTSTQSNATIAALANGDFVVVWQSSGQDGSSYGVFAQRFDSAGAKIGSEFQVNIYTTNDQSFPEVSAYGEDGFVIIWQSYGQDTNNNGVVARAFKNGIVGDDNDIVVGTAAANLLVGLGGNDALDGQDGADTLQGNDGNDDLVGEDQNDSLLGDAGDDAISGGSGDDTMAGGTGDDTLIGGSGTDRANFTGNLRDYSFETTAGGLQITDNRTDGDGTTLVTGVEQLVFADDTVTVSSDKAKPVADTLIIDYAAMPGSGEIEGRLTGYDPEAPNAALTYARATNAANGNVTVNANGTYVFDPTSPTFTGTDSFTYTVTDAQGLASTGTVNIAVGESNFADSGSEYLVNTSLSGQQVNATVTVLADGGHVIAWESPNVDGSTLGVYAQRYAADGTKLGSEFRINTETVNQQKRESITALPDGGFIVVWHSVNQDSSDAGIYGQRYDSRGQIVGREFRANSQTNDGQTYPSVSALADGGFVIVWESQSKDDNNSSTGVAGQRYDRNGNAVGDEFLVNTIETGTQGLPQVTGLADGGFVVAWQSDSQDDGDAANNGVFAQRFDASGEKVGAELQVNVSENSNQQEVSIAALKGGGFVVTWSSNGTDDSDSSGYGVFGRVYDANGSAVGGEFRINEKTTNDQFYQEVVGTPEGGFVVAWYSNASDDTDSSGYGAFARRFDATGTAIGGEFQVNTTTTNDQKFADVAIGPDGKMVIVWQSDQTGNSEIYAKDYIGWGEIVGTKEVDLLAGGSRDNLIRGREGSDSLSGNGGADTLVGGAGGDSLVGGSGTDTASFVGSTAGVVVNLAAGTASGGDAAGDTITGVENLVGSDLADTLVGDTLGNVLAGGIGKDSLSGGAGADTLVGGADADTLIGGDSIDIADYTSSQNGVAVDLASGTGSAGDALGDRLIGIENVLGSTQGDSIVGDSLNNSLDGGLGADVLKGGAGADTLKGGNGAYDDTLIGGAGADSMAGGGGFDWADYTASGTAVSINLSTGSVSGGDAAGDTLNSIENVFGTKYADTLTGDTLGNRLSGGDGTDSLSGGDGADTLIGGAQNDTLVGGAGEDAVWYIDRTGPVDLDLTTGIADVDEKDSLGSPINHIDSMTGIEHAFGSDYDDTLTGTTGANTLNGGFGSDLLEGGGGADTLEGGGGIGRDTLMGGAGSDSMDGGDGTDWVIYTGSSAVTVNLSTGTNTGGDAAGDTITGVENVLGSANADHLTGDDGANVLSGAAGVDTLVGGIGDDTLIGGTNNDSMVGGNGNDWVIYSSSSAAVSVSLTTGPGSGGDAAGDTLVGIEHVLGSDHKDTITGDSLDNQLIGGLHNDKLDGVAGKDTLLGEDGVDTLIGGDGDDLLIGGAGADSLSGGIGIDTATYTESSAAISVNLSTGAATGGTAQGDTLNGVENVVASDHNDTMTGDSLNNLLEGRAGSDSMTGNAGADTLLGGNDNDFVIGGAGSDLLDGGRGIDTASYAGSASVVVNLLTGAGSGGDAAGDTLIAVENLIGSSNADTLLGDGAANVFTGGAGADSMHGDAGNDYFIGGASGDTLVGGVGFDTASYEGSSSAVNVSLATGSGSGGDAAGDTLSEIEALLGSTLNDTFTGDSLGNVLDGAAGADSLSAGDGNDTLIGGLGADILAGGAGFDLAVYLASAAAVIVNLSTGAGSGGDAQGDTLSGIEHLEGSTHNDSLSGDSVNNQLSGGLGDDTLVGAAGQDTLIGWFGNDRLIGGTGADSLVGGSGTDVANYAGSAVGVQVDLTAGIGTTGDAENDHLSGIENLEGSAFADTLIGNQSANLLFGDDDNDSLVGLAGSDTLIGEDGNDTLVGGIGGDRLDGGAGTDSASYATSFAAVSVDLGTGSVSGGEAKNDTIVSIENLIGSAHADTLIGDGVANRISAGSGSDTVLGAAGADTLIGEAGNDTLIGGTGSDLIDGGDGVDAASYAGSGSGVTVNLVTGTGTGGDAAGDTVIGVEILVGSASADSFVGNSEANRFVGGDGADTLSGASGADTLEGQDGDDVVDAGNGNDLITGGIGADSIVGGLGVDAVDYSASSSGVTVNLTTGAGSGGHAASDTVQGVENVIGSAHADSLSGNAEWNSLEGGASSDTLSGAAGSDTLWGGAGGDNLSGGSEVDTATYAGSNAGVLVNLGTGATSGGHAAGDTLSTIENLVGSSYKDTLTGDSNSNFLSGEAGADSLNGGLGSDTLSGGKGADTLVGGDGLDTAEYAKSQSAVSVNLASGRGSGGDAQGDRLFTIENVVGSEFADTVTGDSLDNELDGGLGADLISGAAGADTLHGGVGAGQDTLVGGAGSDSLRGGGGADWASYAASGAAVSVNLSGGANTGGDAAGDTLSQIENILGSEHADTLSGSTLANVLVGSGGTDSLSGGDGADTLIGGNNNDTLVGGAGDDFASYADRTGSVDLDLAAGSATMTEQDSVGSPIVHIDSVSGIEHAIGTAYADTLTGDGNANSLQGGLGTDLLEGAAGADTLQGGAHDDTLVGGAGSDNLDGGDGLDWASYSGSASGVTVNLATGAASGGDAATDTLTNIENVSGSAQADNLTGNADANQLSGGAGVDVLVGGDGDDTLIGGANNDSMVGGNGKDTASYATATDGIRVFLNTGSGQNNDAAGDTLSGIENALGSAFGDTLVGDGVDNVLNGGAGADTVLGNDGKDTLIGDAGADTLKSGNDDDYLDGGDGADSLDGGAGIDTAVYSPTSAAINVNLATGAGTGGQAQGDTLNAIENVVATYHDDTLTGSTADNIFEGGLGADSINGGSGSDTSTYVHSNEAVRVDLSDTEAESGGHAQGDRLTLIENIVGSAFADTLVGDSLGNSLEGGAGADSIVGNDGVDTASYAGATAGITVDLSTGRGTAGDAAGDTLVGIENALGSTHDDVLVASSGANRLDGGNGNDAASYIHSTAGVVVNLGDTLSETGGDAAGDTMVSIENVIGSDYSDTITGTTGANLIIGGKGADSLNGGSGTDTISYAGSFAGVVVNLGDTLSEAGGEAEGDTLVGFENVVGSAHADVLTGDSLGNELRGEAGADTLDGELGADTLVGGGDSDYLDGDGGNDTLIGGEGADNLIGGSGTDIASYSSAAAGVVVSLATGLGTAGEATKDTLSGIENLEGSAFADNLSGDGSANLLQGGDGDDTIIGAAGADTIEGGEGDDLVEGGAGGDSLSGNNGNDTLTYAASASGVTVSLAAGTGSGGDAASDTHSGFEHLIGSASADALTGDTLSNRIEGGSGADTIDGGNNSDTLIGGADGDAITGGNGNDLIVGGAGADNLAGGADIDTVDYSESDAAIIVNLAAGTGSGGHAVGDTLSGVEQIVGSAHNDSVVGDSLGNALTGGEGADTLSGAAGADTLIAGAGDDQLSGGDGSDIYMVGVGGGHDLINNNDASPGSSEDKVLFEAGISSEDLWFQHTGDDLVVSVLGTEGKVVLEDWYLSAGQKVDVFETSDGLRLLQSDVDQLVSAMAAFNPASGADPALALKDGAPQPVQIVIAQSWQ